MFVFGRNNVGLTFWRNFINFVIDLHVKFGSLSIYLCWNCGINLELYCLVISKVVRSQVDYSIQNW